MQFELRTDAVTTITAIFLFRSFLVVSRNLQRSLMHSFIWDGRYYQFNPKKWFTLTLNSEVEHVKISSIATCLDMPFYSNTIGTQIQNTVLNGSVILDLRLHCRTRLQYIVSNCLLIFKFNKNHSVRHRRFGRKSILPFYYECA